MKADDPAFPHKEVPLDDIGLMFIPADTGLTVRDHIAIEAPITLDNALSIDEYQNKGGKGNLVEVIKTLAEMNYIYADAMIEESNK